MGRNGEGVCRVSRRKKKKKVLERFKWKQVAVGATGHSGLRFQASDTIRWWQECEERTRTQHGEMEMGEAVHGWLHGGPAAIKRGRAYPGRFPALGGGMLAAQGGYVFGDAHSPPGRPVPLAGPRWDQVPLRSVCCAWEGERCAGVSGLICTVQREAHTSRMQRACVWAGV